MFKIRYLLRRFHPKPRPETPRQAEIRLRSPAWPLLTGLVLLLQLLRPDRVWMVLLVGLGGAWLVAALWVRSLRRNLRFEREVRFGWAQVGDRLQERFTLVNTGWAPALWVEIQDHSNLPGLPRLTRDQHRFLCRHAVAHRRRLHAPRVVHARSHRPAHR